MIDISDDLAELVQLQGRLVVCFVHFLIQQGLFKNESPLRNLGLVIALWIRYFRTQTHPDLPVGSERWYRETVKLADEHSVATHGPWNIDELCKEIRDNVTAEEDDSDGSAEQDSDEEAIIKVARKDETPSRKWGFISHVRPNRDSYHNHLLTTTQFSKYAEQYRRGFTKGKIGGESFDITKMSKAERDKGRGDGLIFS